MARNDQAAEIGNSIQPFDRAKPKQIEIILQSLPAVLGWEGESLIRFASSIIFGHSKILESYRGPIEACLTQLSDGKFTRLADLGILENERSFLIHGPIRLVYGDGEINLKCLDLPARIGVKERELIDCGRLSFAVVPNAKKRLSNRHEVREAFAIDNDLIRPGFFQIGLDWANRSKA